MAVKKTFLNDPLVSVVIVNWNGGEVFQECLSSLSKIDYPNWELIVVDNGSTDGSEDLVRNIRPPKGLRTILNNKNLGFAPANNQGVEVVTGKYVLLLNNDTKVEKDFLIKMVARMEEDADLGVIQPKIYLMDKSDHLDNAGSFLTRIGFLHHWGFMKKDSPEFGTEREIFSAKGACMLIRKKVVDKVGLFDNDFVSYFEESDFCWRVWLAGYKILFYPDSRIYHKLGFTIRKLDVSKINYHYYKNRICSLIKNLGPGNLLPVLFSHLFISLGIIFIFLIRLKLKSVYMIIKAITWNVTHLSNTLDKRNLIQKRRLVSDKVLFKKLSRPIDYRKYWDDFRRVEEDLNK